jgi:hypothetical protein
MKNTIKNSKFTGVHWDAKAIEAVNTTAKALLNLTELFKSQHITIESMVKIEGPTLSSDSEDRLIQAAIDAAKDILTPKTTASAVDYNESPTPSENTD